MSWHAGYSFIFQLLASRNSSPTRKEILSKSVPDKGLFARGTSFKPIQMKNDFITCYICHFLTNCNQKLKLCQCTAGVPELFTSKEIELSSIAKFNPSFQVRIPCKSSPYLRSVLAYYSLFEITACLPITSMIPECSYFSLWSFSLPFLTKQTISFWLFITWKGILSSTKISWLGLLLPSVSPFKQQPREPVHNRHPLDKNSNSSA